MAQVSFGTFAKRRNSTKQPATLSDVRTVTLKEACSQDRPVFRVTGNNFNYNYCMWDGKYYFIDEITSLRNNEIEISCVMDPLATYKSDILASSQFVCYSSNAINPWLPDTRLPQQKNATVASSASSMNTLFTAGGFYVLSVVGKTGCDLWACDATHIAAILDKINDWRDDVVDDILVNHTYSFNTVEDGLESVGKMLTRTGVVGNAYSEAPSCIRSCIWVPFYASSFVGASGNIYLGQFDTDVTTFKCAITPVTNSVAVSIPWQYNDWRRAVCEEVYLYLPLVGMVSIPSDEIINQSSITVEWSATATDGCIAFRVISGSQVIGTYGANCAVNYPIGISQQASAGEIVQSVLSGIEKTINVGVSSSISPVSIGAASAGIAMQAVQSSYDVLNTENTSHNSCIGGIGGGAGVGLSLDLKCYTVAHPTVVNPADMTATMGNPTMKPMLLSTLTGYCQCANAHVEAPATAGELDAIDSMLNSGFYIE